MRSEATLLLLLALASPLAASPFAGRTPIVPPCSAGRGSESGLSPDSPCASKAEPDPSALETALALELRASADPHERRAGTGGLHYSSSGALADGAGASGAANNSSTRPARRLPFLGQAARDAGYELPLTYGAGAVYYHLDREIEVSDVRVGRNGAAPTSVSDVAQLSSTSSVDNVNVKADFWLLPFLNLYAIAGYVWNESDTTIELTLPPLLPGGTPRRRQVTLPTKVEGSVGGLGVTAAGGYKSFLFALDINAAQADLGFDDRFDALVTSARVGWHGKVGTRPTRLWVNATYWDTFAQASGTVVDPDGGTLRFEVDQGPREPYTYGVGGQVAFSPRFDFAADVGFDFRGGWYVALVPVVRF